MNYEIVPNFRALGPKLGKRMPQCKKALGEADGSALHAQLAADGEIRLDLGGGDTVTLTKDEVEIRLHAREGYAAASVGDKVVVLDTRLTDALRSEGLAREVINRIQTARKTLDLPYEARIRVRYRADGPLAEAVSEHASWIAAETLAEDFAPGEPEGEGHESEVEGAVFAFSVTPLD